MKVEITEQSLSFLDDLIAYCSGERITCSCWRGRRLPRFGGEKEFANVASGK
jgi:hypothetical protein